MGEGLAARLPLDVACERVAASLRAAHHFNEAQDHEGVGRALREAKMWLDRAREAAQ